MAPVARKRKRRLYPIRLRWYDPPFSYDIDLMKPEKMHDGFCSCGRRREGEVSCANCASPLDYDETYMYGIE